MNFHGPVLYICFNFFCVFCLKVVIYIYIYIYFFFFFHFKLGNDVKLFVCGYKTVIVIPPALSPLLA